MTSRAGVHKKGTFSLADLIKNVKSRRNFTKAGAIALFIGVVRGETTEGEKVQKLELEAYEEKASQVLADICRDLKKKPDITDVQIHHILGKFKQGEDLVYVSVTGSHRENLFPVLQEAVNRYKKEAPIFKKEHVKTKKGKTRAYWKTEQQGSP